MGHSTFNWVCAAYDERKIKMGLQSITENIKGSMQSYFGNTSSPTSKVIGDINKIQKTISSESGLSDYLKKQADAGLTKLATAKPLDNSKKQVDGSFLSPNDSTGKKGFMGIGISLGMLALLGGVYFISKR